MDYSGEATAIASAMRWMEGTLLGSLATTVAVLGVASIGFLMLSGRIEVRRAVQVVLGCFIIFGASSIAAGIMGVTDSASTAPPTEPAQRAEPVAAPPAYPAVPAAPYDPYAGAAVPSR